MVVVLWVEMDVQWGCYGHALVPEGAQPMLHALVARLCGGCLHCGLVQPLHGHCRVVDALVALCYGGCLHCGLKQPLHGHCRVVDALVGSLYGDGCVALDEQGLGRGCVEPLHGGDRWCDDALGWVQYGGETPLLLACLWFVLGGGDELGLVLMYFFS